MEPSTAAPKIDDGADAAPVRVARSAIGWVGSDRSRFFGAAAVVALLVCIVMLLLPDGFVTLGLAVVAAGVVAIFGVLAVGTRWAERRGLTDGHDLWDDDRAEDRPEDVLGGIVRFHTEDVDTVVAGSATDTDSDHGHSLTNSDERADGAGRG